MTPNKSVGSGFKFAPVALAVALLGGGLPPTSGAPLTFNRDIAPLVFEHCSGCHRPGQSAPFSLLSYADVQRRATTIVRVTQNRYMPPWLPAPGFGEFAGERRLNPEHIDQLQRWVAAGCPEGNPADRPTPPRFPDGWQLGEPDFILTLPCAYELPATGKDVYRNLVVPVPTIGPHYVKGIEFHPGNARVVHHAFIAFDVTRGSRRRAEREDPPGFSGMELPDTAQMPAGQLLGWQPGKTPYLSPPGLSWLLRMNTDLVLQLHLHPSGRPETVQPSLGFYFTDQPPTNSAFRIGIRSFSLDIPPGTNGYAVDESYTVPVPVALLRVSTHAHYLGKDLQAYALLPDGRKKWLIRIPDWDFNWQGDYEYRQPLELPAGSRLMLHYTYDNSAANPRNPNNPPRRVRYGLQTTDEMGEVWFQTLAGNPADRERLARDYFLYVVRRTEEFDAATLRDDPGNAPAHVRLGHNLMVRGRLPEARAHFAAALLAQPDFAPAHYEMADWSLAQNDLAAAYRELQTVLQLDPGNAKAYGNLGYLESRRGRFVEARAAAEKALRLDPDDSAVRDFLARLPR